MFKFLLTVYIRCYYRLAKFYVFSDSKTQYPENQLKHLEIIKICLRKMPNCYFLHVQLVPIALELKLMELAYGSACAAKNLARENQIETANLLLVKCYLANRQFEKAENLLRKFVLTANSSLEILEQGIAIYMALDQKDRAKQILELIPQSKRTTEIKLIESYFNLNLS